MKRSLTITLQPDLIGMIRILFAMCLSLMAMQLSAQNSAPTDITINSNSIFENSNFGMQVGAFQTVDSDLSDSHTYTLVSGGGDVDNNEFYVTSNGSLRSAATFNYEVKDIYSIRVRTDDGHGGQLEKVFTIDIEDAAESPTNIILHPNSIAENNAVGAVIGTLTAADEDLGETYTYAFTQSGNYPSNSAFEIQGDELRALQSFDYETKDFYVIRVEVQDSRGGNYNRSIAIAINNLESENSAPTNIELNPRTINEENAIGDVIGTLSTTDADAGDTHIYSLEAGVIDNDQFTLTESQLKAGAIFDYETKSSYVVQVKTDDGNGGLYIKNITVLIGNVAESGPPTSTVLSSYSIEENNDLFDPVGTFSSVDPDAGDTFTYTLIAGAGDSGNSSFRIVGNELQANTTFDYETTTSFSILIRTTDGQGNSIDGNFTITIEDLSDVATLDFKLNNNTINENVANGTLVGTLTPINASVPASVNFQFVTGDGDSDNALFNRSGRDISFSGVPDYETKKTYSIRVEADDQGTLLEKVLLIQVNDANEAPTFVNVSSTTIQENNAIGQVVAVLSTDDPDEGDTFTYSFASPEPEFTIEGNLILANETFNFERVPPISYNVTIRSRDAGFQFSPDRNVSFVITNQNESPTDISLNFSSIFENNAAGSGVGTAATTDDDNGDSYTYSVVAGFADAEKFEFSGDQLLSTELFNYEERSAYTIRIQTEDAAGAQFVKDFTIQINDAMESPFDIDLSNVSIAENNEAGDVIGVLSASDPDASDTFTFYVLNSPADGFSFDITNGNELVADEVFDFEDQNSYTINIQVRDQTNRSYTEEFTITINDLNENQAPSALSISNNTVNENNSIGDAIGSFSTTDANAGDSFSYSFISGAGGEDNASFSIIEGNELVANAVFDYETKNSFDIKVRTDDGNGGSLDQTFIITIGDVAENNAPTEILLSPTAIDENNAVNAIVGILSTTDADAGDSHIYSLVTNPGGAFNILNNQLRASESFDFETQVSYDIRIETGDQNGGVFEKDFTITINDVSENNAPTEILLSPTAIDENNAVNAIVGILSTTDADAGDSHIYSFVTNPGNAFNILNDQLRASQSFDFEAQASYDIRIETDDQNGGTFEKNFTITINDVNENQSPTAITLAPAAINENNAVGATIGTLTTVDADAGDSHTYSLQNFLAIFTIEGDQLKADIAFDFETQSSYTISIQTNDGNGGTFTQDVTVTITDVNEEEEDVTGPEIVGFNPVDDATNVALNTDLIVTFDEPIQAGTGLVRVALVNAGTIIINGNPQDGTDQFTVDGSTLTIHMGAEDRIRNFFPGTAYYVEIHDDAVLDVAGNPFDQGWDFNDKTMWNFTTAKAPSNIQIVSIPDKSTSDGNFNVTATSDNIQIGFEYEILEGPATINGQTITLTGATGTVTVQVSQEETVTYLAESVTTSFDVGDAPDAVAPQIVSFSPADGGSVAFDGDLQITFDEPIQAGAGQMRVRRLSNSGVIMNASFANTPNNLSISGNVLTLHLANPNIGTFVPNTDYYVEMFDDIVQDLSGNSFDDNFSDNQTWNFSTERETVTWNGASWSNVDGPAMDNNVVIQGDFTGAFECTDLTVLETVNLITSGTMIVHGNLTNEGSFTVESGASLITYDGNLVSDNIVIKRNTRYVDGKYSFVGTPVTQNASITAGDLGMSVYTYDESVPFGADGINRWINTSTGQELVPGRGYTQAFQQEIVFEGTPNAGTITHLCTYTEDVLDANEGWNLISNPYPAAISVGIFLSQNTNLGGAIYIWDDNGSDSQRGTDADYITANGAMATNTTPAGGHTRFNKSLGSAQGFFVKLSSAADLDVAFTENMRKIGENADNNYFRKTELPIVRLNLTNSQGLFKQAVVGFAEDATAAQMNRTYDAVSFNTNADYGVFTLKAGKALALNGMPFGWEELPLKVNAAEAGTYELAIETENYAGLSVYLKDKLTNELADLTLGSYIFTSSAGQITDRFTLLSSSAVLSLEQSKPAIYAFDKVLYIEMPWSQPAQYQIYNLSGVSVMKAYVNESTELNLGHLANGVYIISDGIETKKIILK